MKRCFYDNSIPAFLSEKDEEILGVLSKGNTFDLTLEQRDAWLNEIVVIKNVLRELPVSGHIIFEYTIPRLGKRIDVALLINDIVFCLEFKVGEECFTANDKEQVWDYALDLKNFHEESAQLTIVPVLVATEAATVDNELRFSYYDDKVYEPLFANPKTLVSLIQKVLEKERKEGIINAKDWINSRYLPTPTIIQAASALYMNHSVEDITKHEADKAGIDSCTQFILDVIHESKEKKQKSICFVTGVPGAGKTLVGLNVAIQQEQGDLAVYLSGNGPLVKVLTEALG